MSNEDIDVDAINKNILSKNKKFTKKELEFAFKKMDIEKECTDKVMAEIQGIIEKYANERALKIIELYEKMFKGENSGKSEDSVQG